MEPSKNALRAMDRLPVSKAVFKNILPSISIFLMMLIYNYADLFFIGLTHNDYMVSAITLASPIFMFFMAFGSLFGTGGLTLISQDTAKGETGRIQKISSFCFWCSIAIGVLSLLLIVFLATPLAKLLGANGLQTVKYTRNYLQWVAVSAPCAVVANTFSTLIRSEGKPMVSMIGMLLGNVINILLDPVFILGLDMGCTGAAIATSIGQLAAAVFYIIYILCGKSSFSLRLRDFSGKDGIARSVFAIGVPAALVTVMMNLYQIISNAVMGHFGDLAVAAMGVSMKISVIGSVISNGVGQGIQPLIGYQVGNGNKKRFKEILRFSLIFSIAVSLVVSVLCFIGAKAIVSVFLTETVSIELGVSFTRIILSTMWISGIINLLSFTIQSMGVSQQATITSLARNGYVGILVVLIMSIFGSVYAVAAAQPIADSISFVIAVMMLKSSMKQCFPDVGVAIKNESI